MEGGVSLLTVFPLEVVLPDHHFHGVNSDSQLPAFWEDEGHPAAAIGQLRVEEDPITGRGLSHDVEIHLHTAGVDRHSTKSHKSHSY